MKISDEVTRIRNHLMLVSRPREGRKERTKLHTLIGPAAEVGERAIDEGKSVRRGGSTKTNATGKGEVR